MRIRYKEPEAIQFTGENFEELQAFAPDLEKIEREGLGPEQKDKDFPFKGYTVGFYRDDATFGRSLSEALPGFWIVYDEDFKIMTQQEFKKVYDKV